MFKELKEGQVERFKEFDEARKFIEYLSENSYDAIDYMITHKEFYFLLKNILIQRPTEKIVAYIFANLPCLKRKDDILLIEKLLNFYKDIIIDYLISCKNKEFVKILYRNGYKKEALKIIKNAYMIDLMEDIIKKETDKEILAEAMQIYQFLKG